MGSLTLANGSVQPVDDATSGDANAAGFLVDEGTTVEVSGSSDQPVTFTAATGMLALDNSSSFSGQISGFGGGDQIDLADIFFGASTTLAYSAQDSDLGTTLTVSDGTDTANLVLFGQYLASDFAISSDSHGGTLITEPLPPAPTVADGTSGSVGANSAAAQAGVLNINSSSTSPVMLSAAVEQAPSEITDGLVMSSTSSTSPGLMSKQVTSEITDGLTMSSTFNGDAFGVNTAATPNLIPPSSGSAFASVSTTTPDSAPSSGGDSFAFAADAGASSGNPVSSITPENPGMTDPGAIGGAMSGGPPPNTWQQNVALMNTYLASTFPPATSGESGSQNTGASLSTPAQGALAAQVLADHQNSS